MSNEQVIALANLKLAMLDAYRLGVLDILQDYLSSPDSINDVTDALKELPVE